MLPQEKRDKFIAALKSAEVTHYGDEAEVLLEPFSQMKFGIYSSANMPINLVIEVAMAFVQKFASYTTGEHIKKSDMFLMSDPLIVYSKEVGSQDRTLVWGNGFVHISSEGEISVAVDKTVIDLLTNE